MDVRQRSEIDERYRWDLTSLFESDEAFEEALEASMGYAESLASYEGRACASAQDLLGFMILSDEASLALGRLATYACRKNDEDTRVPKYDGYVSQLMMVEVAVSSAAAWFSSELIAADPQVIEGFFAECPELEAYRRPIERTLRMREHTLSAPEERLLAQAGEMAAAPSMAYSTLCDSDLTFEDAVGSDGEPHALTSGTFVPLLSSRDRELRKSAFESLYSRYGEFKNTFASLISAQTKQQAFFARVRGYGSALEMALDANEIPVEVYRNLIDTVHRGMAAMHKYVGLRKRVLGLDELHFYDLYVPMVEEVEMEFTYEEACETILEALAPMGQPYLDDVRRALSSRWIDVYENPGKRSGAYSSGCYGTNPFMLLNFQGKLDDVFTLIHEMGHSMHTHLSCSNQPQCTSGYAIFVAEVASTVNEALLMRHLLGKCADRKERIYLLNHFLEQFKGTLYRQTMFAEFELAINSATEAGEPLTSEALCGMYRKLNEEYFGPEMSIDDEIALEWARIPHFYYCYYVYQYATGYAAAISISDAIAAGRPGALESYIGFLSSGSSKDPIGLLRDAGVDMASPEPIDDALAFFDSLLDEMAGLCGASD